MNNINFFLRELDMDYTDNTNYDFNLQKKIDELNNYQLTNTTKLQKNDDTTETIIRELYFNDKCTLKDLLKICNFYNIEKDIKTSKCKKQDIISTIIYFESLPENEKIVQNRYKLWSYMTEISNNPKMKKYVIWS